MTRKHLFTFLIIALATLAGFWYSNKPTPVLATSDGASTDAPEASDASDVATDTSGIVEMTMGPADAKVTVMEYASFTCPHCANFHKTTFKQMKADYIDTGKIQFIYRDVFFDRFGLWASMVARCEGPGKFFGISDMIYKQQSEWTGAGDPVAVTQNLHRIGKAAGLTGDQIDACLEDEAKAKALVAWFQENSTADEVSATPTLLINGEKHSNLTYADLKALIETALAK